MFRQCLRHVYDRQRTGASQSRDIELDGVGAEALGMRGQLTSVKLSETNSLL